MVVLLVQRNLVSDSVCKLVLELHVLPGLVLHVVAGLFLLGEAQEHVAAALDGRPRDHPHVLGPVAGVHLVPFDLGRRYYLTVRSSFPLNQASLVIDCQNFLSREPRLDVAIIGAQNVRGLVRVALFEHNHHAASRSCVKVTPKEHILLIYWTPHSWPIKTNIGF